MTEERFKELEEIKVKINDIEYKIRRVDQLIKSCYLSCEINGNTQHGNKINHYFNNREEITKLLEFDKDVLSKELIILKEKFSKL